MARLLSITMLLLVTLATIGAKDVQAKVGHGHHTTAGHGHHDDKTAAHHHHKDHDGKDDSKKTHFKDGDDHHGNGEEANHAHGDKKHQDSGASKHLKWLLPTADEDGDGHHKPVLVVHHHHYHHHSHHHKHNVSAVHAKLNEDDENDYYSHNPMDNNGLSDMFYKTITQHHFDGEYNPHYHTDTNDNDDTFSYRETPLRDAFVHHFTQLHRDSEEDKKQQEHHHHDVPIHHIYGLHSRHHRTGSQEHY